MTAPQSQRHERRTTFIQARLTVAERCFVQQQAANASLTESEYLRQRTLGHEVRVPRPQSRFDSALVSEINRLGGQVAALGNLANQIALYCHTDRPIPPEWDALPSEIKGLLRLVEQSLEKVLFDDDPQDTR